MNSPDLRDDGCAFNVAFLVLVGVLSIVLLAGAALALIRNAFWQPATITILVSTCLSAAVALVRIFARHQRRGR